MTINPTIVFFFFFFWGITSICSNSYPTRIAVRSSHRVLFIIIIIIIIIILRVDIFKH